MSMQSGEHSRFTDLCDEPVDHLLLPIKGYQDKPLVPLIEAVKPVSGFFNEIEDNIYVALHNCQNPADGLTQEEAASIHLYTMHFDDGPSLYLLLNKSLRGENREALKPWFSFLKLFLTALYQLPAQSVTLWRGVRDIDLSSKYKTGTKFTWWGVSSCTTNIEVLESNQFLGKHGQRTLFSIECINGKSVSAHSYFKNRENEVILMPGSYFEVTGQLNPAPELHIIQLKEITPPITLIKPPFSKPIDINSPSVVNKSSTSVQLASKVITQNTASKTLSKEISSNVSTFPQSSLNAVTQNTTSKTFEKRMPSQSNRVVQSASNPIFNKSSKDIPSKSSTKWQQHGIDITADREDEGAGEYDSDDEGEIHPLSHPHGLHIDDNQTVYIADNKNHRVVSCKCNTDTIEVIAGGNGTGNRNNQLNFPVDVIVDKENDCFIISDYGNRRVMRWYRGKNRNGQIIISDIDCWGLAIDKDGDLYVSDNEKHLVTRWRIGDDCGTIVAGGNEKGDDLCQLDSPTYIFVDADYSLYVSDSGNHRVMKWKMDAKEGIVVAGGNGQGNKLTQLSSPQGVSVNHLYEIYVADCENDRVMCWYEETSQGIVVGGYGQGQESDQLDNPRGLVFDCQGNLYVADENNCRVKKFEINNDIKVRSVRK